MWQTMIVANEEAKKKRWWFFSEGSNLLLFVKLYLKKVLVFITWKQNYLLKVIQNFD